MAENSSLNFTHTQDSILVNHLLVVDDEEINNIILEQIFYNLNIINKVNFHTDGWKALEFLTECKFQNKFPELIIIDVKMPGMDGYEFLERYNHLYFNEYPHTKIVAITNFPVVEKLEDSLKIYNVNQIVSKPLTEEKLDFIIRSLFINKSNQSSIK